MRVFFGSSRSSRRTRRFSVFRFLEFSEDTEGSEFWAFFEFSGGRVVFVAKVGGGGGGGCVIWGMLRIFRNFAVCNQFLKFL